MRQEITDDGKMLVPHNMLVNLEEKINVRFKKLDERAVIPKYAHDGDVGMDMTAIWVEYDGKHDMYVYHTGLAFESDEHYGILLFPRSSNRKTDSYLCNHVGIADSAIYRGEILFCYKNRTSIDVRANIAKMNAFMSSLKAMPFTESECEVGINEKISKLIDKSEDEYYDVIANHPMDFAPYEAGDRIGQMVVIPYQNVKLIERSELSDTERGTGGFGSTGK